MLTFHFPGFSAVMAALLLLTTSGQSATVNDTNNTTASPALTTQLSNSKFILVLRNKESQSEKNKQTLEHLLKQTIVNLRLILSLGFRFVII